MCVFLLLDEVEQIHISSLADSGRAVVEEGSG